MSKVTDNDVPILLPVLSAKVNPSRATIPSSRISYQLAFEMVEKVKAIASINAL